ncbi:TonB-dependent receptor [Novosphingobium sp. FKTRR1]|uniref:TonB-dependent receptor n=1 Tax=unclassified Novosphingobium TaxID=2644732 RepID=UPI001CF02988|nr:TonB-dependent receptor [Novosphingobium sp. FKTRR1]
MARFGERSRVILAQQCATVAFIRPCLTAAALAFAMADPALAAAQDVPPPPLEEAQPAPEEALPATGADAAPEAVGNAIVVTANKREQTLQSAPVAVSVTSAQTLERAQIRDIKDLTSVVPSLRVTQLQSSANTNFIIRGFGNGANNAGIEPSVGVFVDGVYRSRSAAQIGDFPDVSRIEVLRGPQSTLFGKNASVGVISIVTQKPQFRWGGNVEASYGNYNALVAKGVITGPIAKDVAFSLAGGYNRRDGYVDNPGTGGKDNDRNRWFARGQLLWEPAGGLRVRLIGDVSRINENCCAVVNLQPSAATAAVRALGGQVNTVDQRFADLTYTNRPSTNDIRNFGLSGQIDYDLGPLTFTSITAYRGVNAKTDQDSDFTSADLLGRNYQDQRIRTFTQELRVATNIDGPIGLLAGVYYFNEKIDQANQISWGKAARSYADLLVQGASGGAFNLAGLESTFGALSGRNYAGQFFAEGQGLNEKYRLKDAAFSVFGQADFKINSRVTLTGGANYTRDTKHFSANAQSTDVFSGLDIPALRNSATQFGVAQYIGQTFFGVPLASAAQVAGVAAANPAGFAQIRSAAAAKTAPLLGLTPLQYFPAFLGLPNVVEPGRTSDGKLTWVARVAFDLSRKLNLYASYATGFKASSINLSRDSRPFESDRGALAAAGLEQVNQTYGTRFAGPENSRVYEIGLKGDFGIATANIALFQQEIRGFQSNVFTGKGFVLANAGKETVKGFEFEGSLRPGHGLTLNGAFTVLDAKYDSFLLSAVGDLSGTKPAGIPGFASTIGATWDVAVGKGGHHLIVRGDFHYESPHSLEEGLPAFLDISTAAAVAAAEPFRAEIKEVNGSLTWVMPSGLEVTAWGRNITNQRYLVNIFDSPAQIHSISGYTNQPRTWGGTVRYRF